MGKWPLGTNTGDCGVRSGKENDFAHISLYYLYYLLNFLKNEEIKVKTK